MTTIERLWDKAKDDPEQQEIRDALMVDMTLVCDTCGGDVTRNGGTGRYTCSGCGEVTHGDS